MMGGDADDADADDAVAAAAAREGGDGVTTMTVNRCPFMHGSVTCDPYPGYVHGTRPGVCPRGCAPTPRATSRAEDAGAKLKREAEEFIRLYGKERGVGEDDTDRRLREVLESIASTGTYAHTIDELRHGARVAWRNAPKCINRKFWQTMEIVDARECATNEDMFTAVKAHLSRCIESDHVPVLMTIFKPQTPGTNDGARIWNSQLLRYAGHRGDGEETIGDPAELNFTDCLKKYFGWKPKGDEPGMFDLLPVVCQINPNVAPDVFELPEECVLEVPIHHPECAGISALGLKWYGIPAVSNITMDLGGLLYTAAPFNGWYMVTEIATRNFGDEGRYNLLPKIAQAMGIDTSTEETLWRDHALAAINYAVLHSFKRARVSMVDHHTAAASFAQWRDEELATRGYSPGNWKWVLPPTAASTSSLYLGLNKMTEYTLKPALVGGTGLKTLLLRAKRSGFISTEKLGSALYILQAAAKFKKKMVHVKGGLVLYASDGGRTQARAFALWNFLRQRLPMVRPINMANPDADFSVIFSEGVEFVIILASTTGSGAIPTGSELFVNFTKTEAGNVLKGIHYAVCAFGSSAYPKFCAGGKQFAKRLSEVGAREMFPTVTADQLGGEDNSVHEFVAKFFDWLLQDGRITLSLRNLMLENFESRTSVKPAFSLYIQTQDVGGVQMSAPTIGAPAILTSRTQLGTLGTLATVQTSFKLVQGKRGVDYYREGDHVAVHPRTSKALAAYFAAHFDIKLSDNLFIVPLNERDTYKGTIDPAIPNPVTIEYLFTSVLDINAEPSCDLLSVLSHYVEEEECRKELENLAQDEARRIEWIQDSGVRICSIFDHFPTLSSLHREGDISMDLLRDCLLLFPKLRARLYSVSSSPLTSGSDEFDLTVGRVQYRAGTRLKLGFCSDFLASMPLQSTVNIVHRPAPEFRMPRKETTPILMIAGGTGIAPFKGFVERRLHSNNASSQGEAIMVFGCRTRANELYRDFMTEACDRGALSQYLVGYSREADTPKAYVSDVLLANADVVKRIIDNDGHIYVCGDVRIEASARDALVAIVGEDTIRALEESRRYSLDIFGAWDIQTSHNRRLENTKSISREKSLSPLRHTKSDIH